jgi:hypothetical protein
MREGSSSGGDQLLHGSRSAASELEIIVGEGEGRGRRPLRGRREGCGLTSAGRSSGGRAAWVRADECWPQRRATSRRSNTQKQQRAGVGDGQRWRCLP